MKKILPLLLLFLLTACSHNQVKNTDSQAITTLHNESLITYTQFKNNDINLWWQKFNDPQFLQLLKHAQEKYLTTSSIMDEYKTLNEKYSFTLNTPKWLETTLKNSFTNPISSEYWHDGRTLTSAILAQLYFEYQICQQEKIILSSQLKNVDLSDSEKNMDNSYNIELLLEKNDKRCAYLIKNIQHFLSLKSEIEDLKTSSLTSPFYTSTSIYNTSNIKSKNLLHRKDILDAYNQFYSIWIKYKKYEPIKISGTISSSKEKNNIENNHTFYIGDTVIEFPDSYEQLSSEHIEILESQQQFLKVTQQAIIETFEIIQQMNNINLNISQNNTYIEKLAEKIITMKEKEPDSGEIKQLEKSYLDALYLKLDFQKQLLTASTQLYLMLGGGYSD